MPYLHFSKFLIMKLNFTHCTTLHKYNELLCLQQYCANLERTRFKESVAEDLLHQSKPVVVKVVDIHPQGSVGPSKGSINSHGVEWGSLNGQGVNE